MPTVRPTARGAALAVAGAAMVALAYVFVQPFLLVPGVFALALVLLGVVWALTRRVDGTLALSAPELVTEDTVFDVAVRVPARGIERAAIVLTVPWGDGRTPPWQLARQDGWLVETVRIRGLGRGVWDLGPGAATVSDPFGVVTARFGLAGATRVLVAPRPVDRGSIAGGMVEAETGVSGPGDFVDALVRDYRSGDAARRIHWRQSVRRGALMVRAEEASSRPSLLVVLDTDAAAYPDRTAEGRSRAFDEATRIVAGVLAACAGSGIDCWVVETVPARVVVTPGDGAVLASTALAASALATDDAGQHGRGVAPGDTVRAVLRGRRPIVVSGSGADADRLQGLLVPRARLIAVGTERPVAVPRGVDSDVHPLAPQRPPAPSDADALFASLMEQ